jgi:transcriptional regulator with XRE-family HTH domain
MRQTQIRAASRWRKVERKERKKTMPSKHQIALVGPRIRALRKDRDLTQAELAITIGIQQSDLCRMESGEYKVSLESLFKILKIFEMNVAEFFHVATTGNLSPEEQEIVNIYRSLTRASKDRVKEFIQFTDQRVRRQKKPAKQR